METKTIRYKTQSQNSIFADLQIRESPDDAFDNAIKRGMKDPDKWMYMYSKNGKDYFKHRDTRRYKTYPQFPRFEVIKKRLFVDMDGTLSVFTPVDTLEKLYEPGYFFNQQPQMNVVDAIRHIYNENKDIEIFILSSVLEDHPTAIEEKVQWLNKYLPEIDNEHMIFTKCGESKREQLRSRFGKITKNDILLDDYSKNLFDWCPPGKAIKLLNGINSTKGTWTKDKVSFANNPDVLAGEINKIVEQKNKKCIMTR